MLQEEPKSSQLLPAPYADIREPIHGQVAETPCGSNDQHLETARRGRRFTRRLQGDGTHEERSVRRSGPAWIASPGREERIRKLGCPNEASLGNQGIQRAKRRPLGSGDISGLGDVARRGRGARSRLQHGEADKHRPQSEKRQTTQRSGVRMTATGPRA